MKHDIIVLVKNGYITVPVPLHLKKSEGGRGGRMMAKSYNEIVLRVEREKLRLMLSNGQVPHHHVDTVKKLISDISKKLMEVEHA